MSRCAYLMVVKSSPIIHRLLCPDKRPADRRYDAGYHAGGEAMLYGVILTGRGNDGRRGLRVVHAEGADRRLLRARVTGIVDYTEASSEIAKRQFSLAYRLYRSSQ